MDEKLVAKIYIQVCQAVKFLHDNSIIHRDIKPENILLDENLNAKLCDFGWSAEAKIDETRLTFCGTYEYMAPEIFENEEYNGSVDIWSLGILLYEMLHGQSPFVGNSVFKIFKNILKEDIKFKRDVDPNAADIILRILKTDCKKRPDIGALIQHPYIVSHSNTNLIADDNDEKFNDDLEGDEDCRDAVNINKTSTNSSDSSNDYHLEQELRDYVAIDIVDSEARTTGEGKPVRKDSKKTKTLDLSLKTTSPTMNYTSFSKKMSKLSSMDSLSKPKDSSLMSMNKPKMKYDASPTKHKKNLSITHSDRDLSQLYRMKLRNKAPVNSERRIDNRPNTSSRDPNFEARKLSQPQGLKNFFKSKIEEYVFQKDEESEDGPPNDSTNIYLKQSNERPKINSVLYPHMPKTSPENFNSFVDPKGFSTNTHFKASDEILKLSKLNFSKQKKSLNVSPTFIDSPTKPFPSRPFDDTNRDWPKDGVLYSSIDQLDKFKVPKKTLNNKQGLQNKKASPKMTFKNSIHDRNSNINIVINKFYDKAKVYCQTDEVSLSQKLSGPSRKLSNQTADCNNTKRSNKTLN